MGMSLPSTHTFKSQELLTRESHKYYLVIVNTILLTFTVSFFSQKQIGSSQVEKKQLLKQTTVKRSRCQAADLLKAYNKI